MRLANLVIGPARKFHKLQFIRHSLSPAETEAPPSAPLCPCALLHDWHLLFGVPLASVVENCMLFG